MAHSAVGKDNAVIDLWLKGILNEIATGKRGLWKSAKGLLEIMAWLSIGGSAVTQMMSSFQLVSYQVVQKLRFISYSRSEPAVSGALHINLHT
jgi:hypothetical protein